MSLPENFWDGFYIVAKCPYCGKFCGQVRVWANGLEEIVKATGICKTHGEVSLMGCEWGWG
jgi:hypothetical protein